MAAAALGAGVEVDELLPGEVGQRAVADVVGVGRRLREVAGRRRVVDREVGGVDHHVHGLGDRDVGHEQQRHGGVGPPGAEAEVLGVGGAEAEAAEGLGQHPADRRPHLERREAGGVDPEALLQEARHQHGHEEPGEEGVTLPERRAGVALGGLLGPGVPAGDEVGQAGDRPEPHHVEDERVDEIERPVEEVDLVADELVADRSDDVGVEREDARPDEEGDEPPEDEEVGEPRRLVPLGHGGLRGDGGQRRLQRTRPGELPPGGDQLRLTGPGLFPHLPPPADGPAAAVLPDPLPGVVGEGEGGCRGQDVEQDLGRSVHVREDRSCLFDCQR